MNPNDETAQTPKTVAILVASEGIERVELTEPRKALQDAGFRTEVISPEPGTVQTFNHLDEAETIEVDTPLSDASVDRYAGLLLPGGVANPDALRTDKDAVAFITEFVASGKPVAAICHAPWTLIEAGVLSGRQVTSWPSLQTDIRNAGAAWVDEEVVIDGNLITSRNPGDIPAFSAAMIEALEHGPSSAASSF